MKNRIATAYGFLLEILLVNTGVVSSGVVSAAELSAEEQLAAKEHLRSPPW